MCDWGLFVQDEEKKLQQSSEALKILKNENEVDEKSRTDKEHAIIDLKGSLFNSDKKIETMDIQISEAKAGANKAIEELKNIAIGGNAANHISDAVKALESLNISNVHAALKKICP